MKVPPALITPARAVRLHLHHAGTLTCLLGWPTSSKVCRPCVYSVLQTVDKSDYKWGGLYVQNTCTPV